MGDRMGEFVQAKHRAWAIAEATERAVTAEKAGRWLHQYGSGCTEPGAGSLTWTPNFAGSCPGAKEAAAYIREAAMMMLPTIIAEAADMAEADMLKLMTLVAGEVR